MITVTAAIIEKNGLILAARRKPGVHLAGYWEFPGGKLEDGETSEECLARELWEEFGIQCAVGDFFGESIYDYGTKVIRLLGYRVLHLHGTFKCRDHDRISWLPAGELLSLIWAPADIPLVVQLQEEHHVKTTLAYYRNNAREYVEETVAFDFVNAMRQRFAEMLAPASHILDLGCGSGRDSRFFIDQGHRVTPVDAVAEVANHAAQYLARPVRVQKAEELNETETYDGIWACASLLHIPRSRMNETFTRIIMAMRHQGIWFMSFKQGEMESKDYKQRFFNNYSMPLMKQLLVHYPQIKLLEMSESTSILRGGKQCWINVLIKKL
jgi:mutator protein MutT